MRFLAKAFIGEVRDSCILKSQGVNGGSATALRYTGVVRRRRGALYVLTVFTVFINSSYLFRPQVGLEVGPFTTGHVDWMRIVKD